MDELLEAFAASRPDLNFEDIFYVNLPPGIEKQIIKSGGFQFTAPEYTSDPNPGIKLPFLPDTYSSVAKADIEELGQAGLLMSCKYYVYTRNQLAYMVSKSHPWAGKTNVTAAEF